MIEIKEKEKCCGCTACFSVCPKEAITMRADEEGFQYPYVDDDKCINCGLCERVCPILNKEPPEIDQPLKAYVVRNKDREALKYSASGGFFSAVAEYVIAMGGCVYGAIYDENMVVRHWGTQRREDIARFRSSKYVQSDINGVFEEIQARLQENMLVCFSGTPCQVEGLKKYLRKEYKNLITVDLICHGVPSPMLWEQYVKSQQTKYKSEIVSANFRNKDYGYQNSTLKLSFKNGKEHHGSSRNDEMMRCFFGEISSRPSCYNCSFKFAKHESDFTIFDAWHGAKLIGQTDDNKGYTHLFVQTERGQYVLQQLKNSLDMVEIDAEDAIRLDGPMVRKSAKPHKDRRYFLSCVYNQGIDAAVEKYIPISRKDRILVSTKGVLYRFGILKIIQKIAKKIHI